jgi:hypothetical protein
MHPMSVYPYSNELKITDRSQHCSGGRLKYSSIPIARSSRQKFNKEILELNDTIDLMNLTCVYGVFHPTTAQCSFLSVLFACP